jgi:clusterin-associated protein 1
MSFREVRTLCEIMRTLGYPRVISESSFKSPNFNLVAEIMAWMCHRLDSDAVINEDVSSEAHRVQFVKRVVDVLLSRAGIRLNAKSLYSADASFVKEFLKLLLPIYNPPEYSDFENIPNPSLDVKQMSELSSKLIENGGALFELLQNEPELRRQRSRAIEVIEKLGDLQETRLLEKHIDSLLTQESQQVEDLRKGAEEHRAESQSIQAQIKKRQADLERTLKRLDNMKQVKPAFLAEYQKLEADLKTLYDSYVDRFRNTTYLEACVDQLTAKEQQEMLEREQWIDAINKRLRDEELRQLRGEVSQADQTDYLPRLTADAPEASEDDNDQF